MRSTLRGGKRVIRGNKTAGPPFKDTGDRDYGA